MTGLACGRELRGLVIWIICLVVVGEVAADTGVGRVVVVAIVAGCTLIGDSRMRPQQGIEIIVIGE